MLDLELTDKISPSCWKGLSKTVSANGKKLQTKSVKAEERKLQSTAISLDHETQELRPTPLPSEAQEEILVSETSSEGCAELELVLTVRDCRRSTPSQARASLTVGTVTALTACAGR